MSQLTVEDFVELNLTVEERKIIEAVSPIVSLERTEGGALIIIKDVKGTHQVLLYDGQQGAQGEKGDKGDKGDKGETGDVGPQGPQGIQGSKGDTGETGPQGIQGERGPQGIQGERGPQGEQGIQGPQGEQGETGPKGDKGDPGEVTQAQFDTALGDKAPVIISSASGAIASFPDGADDMPIKSLKVGIEPVQDLHGYDHPWPAGGGKNLLDLSKASFSGGAYGLSITHSGDIVTVSGTVSNTSLTNLSFAIIANYSTDELSGKGYVCEVFTVGTPTHSIGAVWGFRTESERAFAISLSNAPQGSVVNVSFKMSVSATSQTAWTPYSNICPITGWTGAKVTRTGINIWDEEWEQGQYNTQTGAKAPSNYHIRCKNQIPVKPNTEYFYSTNGFNVNVCYMDANMGFLGNFNSVHDVKRTTPDNCYYVVFNMAQAYGLTYNHDISINYPFTATSYEPYQGETYDIEFPSEAGTVFGGTLDVSTGVLTVDRFFKAFTSVFGRAENESGYYWYTTTKALNIPAIKGLNEKLICNRLYPEPKVSQNSYEGKITFYENGIIRWKEQGSLTLEAYRAYIANNPLEICYEIATPITYHLTPQEIKTLLGQNNIWADTGDTEAEYPADTKLYIQNLTKPTEDDMTANVAITSGKFFMINNRLFLATAAIASGAMIIPGTNCSELSLADALNNINS